MREVHELKITPSNFNMVVTGGMTFQIRKHDRDFREGDIVFLKEFKGKEFTGRTQPCKLNLILTHTDGLKEGFCLLNIKLLSIHVNQEGKRYVTNLK
ncbi:RNA-binding protein [Colwellia phage 9A]|uniref:DUF3850 domain-containing protein n=1 Tax=Colwellia phage 9A TaxID=765765 RepID=I3UMH8_9CAUD|nr:RNA-binding protein [Colwellia phage 9A]AFK66693.1 hypothetical protein COPG_00097 [Colwellia phage 9A]